MFHPRLGGVVALVPEVAASTAVVAGQPEAGGPGHGGGCRAVQLRGARRAPVGLVGVVQSVRAAAGAARPKTNVLKTYIYRQVCAWFNVGSGQSIEFDKTTEI